MQDIYWETIRKSDPIGVAIANRHYSRIQFGTQGSYLGPPGRLICFLTNNFSAVWVSHWPYAHLALDRLDAYRCTMFRNEGYYHNHISDTGISGSVKRLSSELILEAMAKTESVWGTPPPGPRGWITWIAPSLVQSDNAGYCFKQAGWQIDREWSPSRRNVQLIRLMYPGY